MALNQLLSQICLTLIGGSIRALMRAILPRGAAANFQGSKRSVELANPIELLGQLSTVTAARLGSMISVALSTADPCVEDWTFNRTMYASKNLPKEIQ
jgi:hypothetical protein